MPEEQGRGVSSYSRDHQVVDFSKVIAMIDEMVISVKTEQSEDDKQERELHQE